MKNGQTALYLYIFGMVGGTKIRRLVNTAGIQSSPRCLSRDGPSYCPGNRSEAACATGGHSHGKNFISRTILKNEAISLLLENLYQKWHEMNANLDPPQLSCCLFGYAQISGFLFGTIRHPNPDRETWKKPNEPNILGCSRLHW